MWFFFHPIATIGGPAGDEKGCYLASGSKDQTIRIWSSAKGKGEPRSDQHQCLKADVWIEAAISQDFIYYFLLTTIRAKVKKSLKISVCR